MGHPVQFTSFLLFQGCYRFNDGHVIRNVAYGDFECKSDCSRTYKVIAPVYVQNSQCSLLWNESSYIRDDQLWQSVTGKNEGIALLSSGKNFRGFEIKVIKISTVEKCSTNFPPITLAVMMSRSNKIHAPSTASQRNVLVNMRRLKIGSDFQVGSRVKFVTMNVFV